MATGQLHLECPYFHDYNQGLIHAGLLECQMCIEYVIVLFILYFDWHWSHYYSILNCS